MSSQILINSEILSPTYFHEKFLHRDKEKTALLNNIKNYVNTFIHGPCGSGKTSLLKCVISDLTSDIKYTYVDCSLYQTTYAILKEILPRGDFILSKSNYELTKELVRYSRETRPVICLDEFDKLKEKGLIAKFMSLRICVILTSEDESSFDSLNSSIRANIPSVIRLKPYTPSQTLDILKARAEEALARWSYSEGVLKRIANISKGNMTLALNLLKLAALNAEREGKSSIEENDIPEIPGNCSVKLSYDENVIMGILKEFKTIPAGKLYELYTKRTKYPKSERTFRSYMRRLCLKGLVKGLGDKKGRIYQVIENAKSNGQM